VNTIRHRAAPTASRRGLTTPLVAAALLLSALGLALILDRLWLEAAQMELTTAGEAAALAAAQSLASDDRLRSDNDSATQANRALDAASRIAGKNWVAGVPVTLDLAAGDVQIGQVHTSEETGESQFVQTDSRPTHVQVMAHRSRSRGNPVALFISQLTRQPYGDVVAQVEAGLDNHLVGVRPFDGGPVPAFPLAILQKDPAGQRTDTWDYAIIRKRGTDEFGYDAEHNQVTASADGLPELKLRSQSCRCAIGKANLQVLDLGTGFDSEQLLRQFKHGWSKSDLDDLNGELRIGSGWQCLSVGTMQSAERDALEQLIGQTHLCLLYSQATPDPQSSRNRTTCVDIVAIRVMAVRDASDGSAEIVVQPAVMTTRTAITEASAAENPYVYRLTLTR